MSNNLSLTLEIKAPELVQAINNFAKAQLAAAKAAERLADVSPFAGVKNIGGLNIAGSLPPAAGPASAEANTAESPTPAGANTAGGLPSAVNPASAGANTAGSPPSAAGESGESGTINMFADGRYTPLGGDAPSAEPGRGHGHGIFFPSAAKKAPVPTLEELARAAASLLLAGKATHLMELLGRFGVSALAQLPKEQFGPFAEALKSLGADL